MSPVILVARGLFGREVQVTCLAQHRRDHPCPVQVVRSYADVAFTPSATRQDTLPFTRSDALTPREHLHVSRRSLVELKIGECLARLRARTHGVIPGVGRGFGRVSPVGEKREANPEISIHESRLNRVDDTSDSRIARVS
jgi:hypothetical protein